MCFSIVLWSKKSEYKNCVNSSLYVQVYLKLLTSYKKKHKLKGYTLNEEKSVSGSRSLINIAF